MTQPEESNSNTLVTERDILLVAEEWIKTNVEFKNQILIAAKARILASKEVSENKEEEK